MSKMRKLILVVGAAGGVLIVIIIAILVGMIIYAGLRWHHERLPEPASSGNIWLRDGGRLEEVVDLSVFNNFRPGMSLDEAKQEFGPPDQTRFDQMFSETLHLWTNGHGTAGVILVHGSYPPPTWQLWGYPNDSTPGAVIRDPNLLSQVTRRIDPEKKTWVHVGDADGQVRFLMDQHTIEFMTLTGKQRPINGESN